MYNGSYEMIGNYVMHRQHVIDCKCGRRFTGNDYEDALVNWAVHFALASAHSMVSIKKNLPWHATIACSCGERFSDESAFNRNAESKFKRHQDNPGNPIWDPHPVSDKCQDADSCRCSCAPCYLKAHCNLHYRGCHLFCSLPAG